MSNLVLSIAYPGVSTSTVLPEGEIIFMKKKLQDYGINVPPGNKGELSGKGITGSFEWDGKSDLTLRITKKPFFISCGTADKEITKFVDQCKSLWEISRYQHGWIKTSTLKTSTSISK